MSEHWLEHAHGRIVAGDDELEVLADYGWVQITDEERAAIYRAEERLRTAYVLDDQTADILRSLLKRTGKGHG